MPFDTWSVPGDVATAHVDELVGADKVVSNRWVPGEAESSELLRTLRRARAALLERPASELAALLGGVGLRFLDPMDDLRRAALEALPASAGISASMARSVLDGMAADWCPARLQALLDAEFEGGGALDAFVASSNGSRARALGPPLAVHFCSGSVPGVSVTSMLRSLLVKSATLLKPGRGDEVLGVLFRRGLEEASPEVARASAVVYWPGGAGEPLERTALADADLVVVYGGDEAVGLVRARANATAPVVVHPHRVGFGVVGDTLTRGGLESAAGAAARAVALFDQRGCVSPHLFYVLGPAEHAAHFADLLAGELARLEGELPSGSLDVASAAALHQMRGTAELLGAAGRGRVWSGGAASWTVALGTDSKFEPSCLGRFVRVKPAESVATVLDAVRPVRRHMQTVGVAGLSAHDLENLSEGLARLGGARVAPLEATPWPPPWWHHDGMGSLTSLVRWTDIET